MTPKPTTKSQSQFPKKGKKPSDIIKLERSEKLEKGYSERWRNYHKKTIQTQNKKEQAVLSAKMDYLAAKIQLEKAKRKIIQSNHFLKTDKSNHQE